MLSIVAPVFNAHPEGAPPMIPILFITIACGAISGFHCLVASGTTSKQLRDETDAQAVGYGSMLTEGFLATLVIVSCVAGLGLSSRYNQPQWGPHEFFITNEKSTLITMSDDQPYESSYTILITDEKLDVSIRHYNKHSDDETNQRYEIHVDHRKYIDEKWQLLDCIKSTEQWDFQGRWIQFGQSQIWVDKGGMFSGFVITGEAVFNNRYASWSAAGSLGAKVGAFVDGAANLVKSIGIPAGVSIALMGVLVASFAGTTMDTSCRLQRYVIQELARTFLPRRGEAACTKCGYDLSGIDANTGCPECAHANAWRLNPGEIPSSVAVSVRLASKWNPFKWLATTHGATVFAVVSALALAAIPAPGQAWSLQGAGAGGLILWPLFGATNQLLGGLAFCVIAAWLIATKRPWWFVALPAALMLVLPAWAMGWQAFVGDANTPSWWTNRDWLLVIVAAVILVLEAWLVVEVALRLIGGVQQQPATTSDSDATSYPPD